METELKKIISDIKYRKGLNQAEIAKELGVKPTYLSDMINERVPFNETFRQKLYEVYSDLIIGEGEMLKNVIPETEINRIERNKKTAEKLHEIQTVPLFDSVATLGLVDVINGAEGGNVLDYISIPNLPKSDGAILVTGDSMYPLLKSGDIVALKIINIADIVFGEMHYVEYWGHDFETEFKVVKYVKKSEKGEDFVQLVSYNQHHEPKDISVKQIKTVAIVNASIRYNRL